LVGVEAAQSDWVSPVSVKEGAINDQIEFVAIVGVLGGLREGAFGCLNIFY
jgi:hypothetical protein